MPLMQIRKIRNATHDDIEYENSMAISKAINKIEIPIDRGFIIINIFMEIARIINVIVEIIYNYEGCTHSLNIKGLCALYTNLYMGLCSSSVNT